MACLSLFKLPSFRAQLFWTSRLMRVMSKASLELSGSYIELNNSNSKIPSDKSVKFSHFLDKLF